MPFDFLHLTSCGEDLSPFCQTDWGDTESALASLAGFMPFRTDRHKPQKILYRAFDDTRDRELSCQVALGILADQFSGTDKRPVGVTAATPGSGKSHLAMLMASGTELLAQAGGLSRQGDTQEPVSEDVANALRAAIGVTVTFNFGREIQNSEKPHNYLSVRALCSYFYGTMGGEFTRFLSQFQDTPISLQQVLRIILADVDRSQQTSGAHLILVVDELVRTGRVDETITEISGILDQHEDPTLSRVHILTTSLKCHIKALEYTSSGRSMIQIPLPPLRRESSYELVQAALKVDHLTADQQQLLNEAAGVPRLVGLCKRAFKMHVPQANYSALLGAVSAQLRLVYPLDPHPQDSLDSLCLPFLLKRILRGGSSCEKPLEVLFDDYRSHGLLFDLHGRQMTGTTVPLASMGIPPLLAFAWLMGELPEKTKLLLGMLVDLLRYDNPTCHGVAFTGKAHEWQIAHLWRILSFVEQYGAERLAPVIQEGFRKLTPLPAPGSLPPIPPTFGHRTIASMLDLDNAHYGSDSADRPTCMVKLKRTNTHYSIQPLKCSTVPVLKQKVNESEEVKELAAACAALGKRQKGRKEAREALVKAREDMQQLKVQQQLTIEPDQIVFPQDPECPGIDLALGDLSLEEPPRLIVTAHEIKFSGVASETHIGVSDITKKFCDAMKEHAALKQAFEEERLCFVFGSMRPFNDNVTIPAVAAAIAQAFPGAGSSSVAVRVQQVRNTLVLLHPDHTRALMSVSLASRPQYSV